jgi:hypothetical protein
MPIDFSRVQAVFQDVSQAAAADRPALLEMHCGSDAELRRNVEALLAAHDDSKDLPAAEPEQTAALPPSAAAGQTIAGRYKLLERLGEGGMGEVWVAEQSQPVRRKVAVKLIKPGMDSKSVLARFEAERQALAVMDHPNIAKVLDGGMTEAGRPFLGSGVRCGQALLCDAGLVSATAADASRRWSLRAQPASSALPPRRGGPRTPVEPPASQL